MRLFVVLLSLLASAPLSAETVFKIEVGKDYKNYSQSDLQRRVWELERAVWQLQRRIYDIEAAKPESAPAPENWVCTVHAMGNTFTGTGPSKALATAKSIENCKSGNNGDGFFCKNPKCEQ